MNIDNFLIKNVHIVPGSTVILGISGGPDSMALLSLMQEFTKKVPLKLVVAHVNHNVRKESDNELLMVKKYCEDNNIIFESTKFTDYEGYNFHAEARDKRYEYFNSLIDKYDAKYLMTAHHGDDLVETVIMRLVRGSTMKGYAGIESIIDNDKYQIIRPLLPYTKEDLIKYDDINYIPYAVDSSNKDDKYMRNRIRNHILPLLKKEDSNVQEKFIKFSNLITDYYNYAEEHVQKIMPKVYQDNKLNLVIFKKQEELIQRLIIQNVLLSIYKDKISLIDDNNVDEIIKIVNTNKPNITISLPNDYCCVKEYNYLVFKKTSNKEDYDVIFDKEVYLPSGKRIMQVDSCEEDTNYVSRFDLNDIELPLHIRTKKQGDIMIVRGLNGSQKVGDIFTNAKINKEDRDIWPIVTDNSGKIIWIPGVKKSSISHRKNEKYDIILRYL
jgi:tRNA(Ile)-lysidine synthase